MTLRDLNAHAELRRRLAKAGEIKAALEIAAEPGAQNLTGMPHPPGYGDKLGDLAAEIADVSREMEELRVRIQRQEPEIISFISAIPDGRTRLIFRLRFLRCMTWTEVAKAVGGKNTNSGVRKTCFRYLDTL